MCEINRKYVGQTKQRGWGSAPLKTVLRGWVGHVGGWWRGKEGDGRPWPDKTGGSLRPGPRGIDAPVMWLI